LFKSLRLKSRRLHVAQLGILVWLGGILIHLAQMLIRNLHSGVGTWLWKNLTMTQILFSGLDYIAVGLGLVLAGLVLTYFADARPDEDKGIQDLLRYVEVAAAGDLSRVPDEGAPGAVGQLAHAIGRLVTVLARSENLVYHLSTLVESSSEAIISFSLEGTILSWNKGAQRIYGYSSGEAKGKSIAILSPMDLGAEIMQHLQGIRQGDRVQPFETTHRASNGRAVRAFVRVSAIFDSTRNVIAASFCAQELTDQPLLQPKSSDVHIQP
jgi:PAS domain S-box-containing protein